MNTVKGDLIQMALRGEFDVIAHGCNCFCCMGGGIALQIKQAFPGAYIVDRETEQGDVNKLGTFSEAEFLIEVDGVEKSLWIVNLYTQYDVGKVYGSKQQERYDAIKSSLSALNERFPNSKIGIPKIGAGLAGGDWDVISKIIDKVIPEVTLIEYDPFQGIV